MNSDELKARLKNFSLRIAKLVDAMPMGSLTSVTIAHQIIRSGTSPAANYRAACIAKSDRDFLNKLKMVEEELDETLHWLEMIVDCGIFPESRMEPIQNENKELLSIIVKSIKTVRNNIESKKN